MAKTQSPRKQKNIHISCCCVFNSLARSHRTPARSASMIIKDNKKEKRTCTQMLSKRINAHGNQKQVSFEKKENRTVTTTAFSSVTTGWRQRARRKKPPLRESSQGSESARGKRRGGDRRPRSTPDEARCLPGWQNRERDEKRCFPNVSLAGVVVVETFSQIFRGK